MVSVKGKLYGIRPRCCMMTAGMGCPKIPVVVAALLCVLTNAQCVARCVAFSCDQLLSSPELPPCHRHQPPTRGSKPCPSAVIIVDGRVPSVSAYSVDGKVVAVESAVTDACQPAGQLIFAPASIATGSAVFRILRV